MTLGFGGICSTLDPYTISGSFLEHEPEATLPITHYLLGPIDRVCVLLSFKSFDQLQIYMQANYR